MAESKSQKLPRFKSNQELVEFFETHDMGEYEDELPEAHFEVEIEQSHYLVAVDEQIMGKLLEVAKQRQVSVEMLVNDWLKEKLLAAG
ncbi:MAG: CopG family antitoxin [Thainema sp.]